jgi:hypothetical protein
MKKLPYKTCFIVFKINDSVSKFFFGKVENFDGYSDFNFDNHIDCIVDASFSEDDDDMDNLMLLCCESYLNSKEAIKIFKANAKKSCFLKSEMCASLEFNIKTHDDDDSFDVEIEINAYDENRGAFNSIATQVNHEDMSSFIEALSVEQQDLLFEFV